MNIFYDIGEVITREFNKLTGKSKSFSQLTLSDAQPSSVYPIASYRVRNSYVVATDDEGQICNVFYDRTTSTTLATIITQRGFPLCSDVGLTKRSLVNSINRAYGLRLSAIDIVDGPFDPTTATTVTLQFSTASTYFSDGGSVTLSILGTYKLTNSVCIGKPVVYNYQPGVWDEAMIGNSQTGNKASMMVLTAKTDYSPIAHILSSFQGMISFADDQRLLKNTYKRGFLLAAALKCVDGLDWCIDSTLVQDFNLYNGWILYNGSAKRFAGFYTNPGNADKLINFSTDLVDTRYDRVMVISVGNGMYSACSLIHYNLGK